MPQVQPIRNRSCAPVFVVGSARSGTTILYDMLLSAGGFAVYLGESNIFNLLAPRFGDLAVRKNREQMLEGWLGSRLFRVSGLERHQIEERIAEHCRNAGDFLRIVMNEIARQQGMYRWAGNAPEEILHLRHIKETIPDALVVHMIRDGRDVSVSLSEKRYIRPFPWKDRETPEGAALYWEWIVQKGRAAGATLGNDYTEVRFEELVRDPRSVLQRLGRFLDHDLNYDTIQKNALGTVARPNTSFGGVAQQGLSPVGRWKKQLRGQQLIRIESLVGKTLTELGYGLANKSTSSRIQTRWNRRVYQQFFELKLHWKKSKMLRVVRPGLTSRKVDEVVIVDDAAGERMRYGSRAANFGSIRDAIA